jgi:glycosyltransferase involved in cell wall biosynthesis
MLSHGYFPRIGGAERLLGAVSPLLQARRVDVLVLTRRLPGTVRFERVDGVPVQRLPAPGPKPLASLMFTLAALAQIAHLKPDLIHAHELISPATTAVLAKFLFGKPVVATIHGSGLSSDVLRLKRRFLGRTRLKVLCREIAAFCVISSVIDGELAAEGVPVEKRVSIPNGVDTARFIPLPAEEKAALRSRLGLPLDAPLALFVGRLSPEKRVGLLTGAWATVRAAIPQACLMIVGGGPDEVALKQQAGEGVLFMGSQPDVLPYLQAADLFVLPSAAEGLSLALLEALACGLPAIATAVGGNPEVIAQGENGWLVPPDDPAALAAAIRTLLADDKLRRSLGEHGRAQVVQRYSLATMADRLVALYRQVLGFDPKDKNGV